MAHTTWLTRTDDDLVLSDGLSIRALAAQFGTPLLVYSEARFRENVQWLRKGCEAAGIDATIAFALKSCTHIEIAKVAERLGLWCEVVSGPEYSLARAAGFQPDRIVINGLGWDDALLRTAISERVALLNIDNACDLERVSTVAQQVNEVASVCIRIVPDVPHELFGDVGSKLGAPVRTGTATALLEAAVRCKGVRLVGLSAHVLHRETDPSVVAKVAASIASFAGEMSRRLGIHISVIDLGGGLDERAMLERAGVDSTTLLAPFADCAKSVGADTRLVLEPGRLLIGDAGIVITTVRVVKTSAERKWLIVDASTNLLVPIPAAHFEVLAVDAGMADGLYSVADRLCSPSSVIQSDARLPEHTGEGSLLAIGFAGAYTWSLAENWSYELPMVVLAHSGGTQVLLDRQSATDNWMRQAGVFS